MSVLIFLIVLYVLLGLSMMKLFEKAGIPGWKALVPGLAAVEWCNMIGRKPWFALWLLFPIVNIFIYVGMCVDMVRSFGKFSFLQATLAVVYAPIPFFLIGRNPDDKYLGPILTEEREYFLNLHAAMKQNDKLALKKVQADTRFRKSQLREWTEAIVFAVFAAAFIRMFLIEAYVIPTSSMEGTLKVGDFLFVSKAHYGIRTPMTVIQFPLIHNRLPVMDRESYLRNPSLPYYRLPAIETVDRNEPVVFNFPTGDSVVIKPARTTDVYQLRRFPGGLNPRDKVVSRPIDKKDHYIKRCIAVAGDSLVIRNRQVFINGQAVQNPTHMQFAYKVSTGGTTISRKKLEEFGVNLSPNEKPQYGDFFLDAQQAEKVRALGSDVKVDLVPAQYYPTYLFPNDPKVNGGWTVDDYGPIWVPKKGVSVPLTPESLPFYERIIRVYEKNELVVQNGKYFINGQPADSYTFKQNYYWMMGDNRHNSEDSRVWGFVPEDHIVGKPLFIWFSTKNGSISNGINWDRIFKSASTL